MRDGHLGQTSVLKHRVELSEETVTIHLPVYCAKLLQLQFDSDEVDKMLENSAVVSTTAE